MLLLMGLNARLVLSSGTSSLNGIKKDEVVRIMADRDLLA